MHVLLGECFHRLSRGADIEPVLDLKNTQRGMKADSDSMNIIDGHR